jgi:hypothetical protein
MAIVVARTDSSRSARRPSLAGTGAALLLALALLQSGEATPQGATGALRQNGEATPQVATGSPPPRLQDTGLYADFETLRVDPAHLAFAPQYPLWSDGATKRRWISLPPGTAIDASDPEAWVFPIGTRLWKEFSFNGQRVETRYLERRADGQWLYAAYAWSPDGREAQLVSERGKRNAYPLGAGRSHTIPGVSDCKVCHQGGRTEVLGFSALQLSSDRDHGALHAEARPDPGVDLRFLVDRGLLVGLPQALLDAPPRIAAASPEERTALGYMHGNCGHCHNDQGSLKNIGLFLRQPAGVASQAAVASAVGQSIKKPAPGMSEDAVLRIARGHPERSGLVQRIASRYPALQMPPLGTELIDEEAVSVLRRWIAQMDDRHAEARWGEKGEPR